VLLVPRGPSAGQLAKDGAQTDLRPGRCGPGLGDNPQLASCDRDRPMRHLGFFGAW
jgi:hypothetical protein